MAEAKAHLRNYPTSPRKMRYVADLIRGMEVSRALEILSHVRRAGSKPLEKLLYSAIKNWEQNEENLAKKEDRSPVRPEDAQLYIKSIYVNGGRTLKRWLPAPQGRAYKIRKRTNHVTIMIDSRLAPTPQQQKPERKGRDSKLPASPTQEQAPDQMEPQQTNA